LTPVTNDFQLEGAIFLFKGAGHSDDENWLRRTAEFEAELKRSDDSADFLSVPVPIESSTSLNDHGWAPKQTIIIIAVKMIKWKNNSNRRNYNNNYSRDNNNIRDSFGKTIIIIIVRMPKEREMVPTIINVTNKLNDMLNDVIGFQYEFNSLSSENELATAYEALFNVKLTFKNFMLMVISNKLKWFRSLPFEENIKMTKSVKVIERISLQLIRERQKQAQLKKLEGKDLLSLLININQDLPPEEKISENELAAAYDEIFNPKITFMNFLLMVISDKFKWIRYLPFEANIKLINSVKVIERISLHIIRERQKQAQLKKLEGKDLLSLLININQDLPPEEK
ncbi:1510_t:CDS:2, partial [Entrophospora sp. SA101]